MMVLECMPMALLCEVAGCSVRKRAKFDHGRSASKMFNFMELRSCGIGSKLPYQWLMNVEASY